MTSLQQRQALIDSIDEATTASARQASACAVLGLNSRTLQRWQAGDTLGDDRRPQRQYTPPHALTAAERARRPWPILLNLRLCHPARLSRAWPIRGFTWAPNRPYIAY